MQVKSKTIKKISSKDLKDYKQLISFLKKDGYKQIGSGMYAYCYAKKGEDFVIKIFNIEYDRPYYAYLNKIKKLKNPYTPKILEVIKKNIGKCRYCLVVMEKLKHYQDLKVHEVIYLVKKHFDLDSIKQSYDELTWDFETPIKALQRVFKILNEINLKMPCYTDIHEDNIMFRKIEQGFFPVIIDPLYG